VLVTPNARLFFKKLALMKIQAHRGPMFSLVELSMRGIMKKTRKKVTKSIFKTESKLISRSELPHFTVVYSGDVITIHLNSRIFYSFINPCHKCETIIFPAVLWIRNYFFGRIPFSSEFWIRIRILFD
jgi:hypothetical protein